jgi:hypothetical protein
LFVNLNFSKSVTIKKPPDAVGYDGIWEAAFEGPRSSYITLTLTDI